MGFSSNGDGQPNPAPQNSLAEDLGDVADDMRQLYTDFGLRPYRVFSVIIEWTGGELYRGEPRVICEKEFLPTPYIDLRPLYSNYTEAGILQHGDIVMREVSPSITEDQIRELCFNGEPLPKNQQGFIEVTHDRRKGNMPKRRRFVVRGAPWHDAEKFQWVVALSEEDDERNRNGAINQPTLDPPRIFRPS